MVVDNAEFACEVVAFHKSRLQTVSFYRINRRVFRNSQRISIQIRRNYNALRSTTC
jgi:hypothetical protein